MLPKASSEIIHLRIIQCMMNLKFSRFPTQDEPENGPLLKKLRIPYIICNHDIRH